MENNNLRQIFEISYKNQYDELNKPCVEIYERAVDKQYAIKTQLATVTFAGSLITGTDLDKKIIELYTHIFKLGGDITDVINQVPDTDKFFNKEKELKNEQKANEVTVEWKRILGIPYKIKKISAKLSGKLKSRFEYLIDQNEIASQLGKQRAVVDLHEQLKSRFLENGGFGELLGNDAENPLPVEYKHLSKLKESLERNDLVEFFNILQSIFASLSYDMKITEGYFHSHIHLILKLMDFEILSEVETNQGRIDSVIESKNYIHIIEFKQYNCDIALDQIIGKKYYEKYFLKNKKIVLVGVAVDKKLKNIVDWKIKTTD